MQADLCRVACLTYQRLDCPAEADCLDSPHRLHNAGHVAAALRYVPISHIFISVYLMGLIQLDHFFSLTKVLYWWDINLQHLWLWYSLFCGSVRAVCFYYEVSIGIIFGAGFLCSHNTGTRYTKYWKNNWPADAGQLWGCLTAKSWPIDRWGLTLLYRRGRIAVDACPMY